MKRLVVDEKTGALEGHRVIGRHAILVEMRDENSR